MSCEKFLSYHKKYLDQLPKELYNITPEEFRRAFGILLNSIESLRSIYAFHTLFWFLWMVFGEVDTLLGLNCGSFCVAKLMEIKSIEKVVLLLNLHKQGNIPIQTAVLQLIKEVKKSDRRCNVVCSLYVCVLFAMLFQSLTGINF